MSRNAKLALFMAVAISAAAIVWWKLGARVDPARALFADALPAWQVVRLRPGSVAGNSVEARNAVARIEELAQKWPRVRSELDRITDKWPDEDVVRDAARTLDEALRDAGLAYYV